MNITIKFDGDMIPAVMCIGAVLLFRFFIINRPNATLNASVSFMLIIGFVFGAIAMGSWMDLKVNEK